jgi:site-specific recombinase
MTTPSAEEVAVKLVRSISVLGHQNEWKRIKSLIEIALSDFAEERVKEATEHLEEYASSCRKQVDTVRRKGSGNFPPP